ncbi:MAG TPA: hypothetical protein VHY31_20905 [Streptosporangiaceae bacterium]|jgi:hypothetical protein|nr:hypothetical protein [Streptosporangiaceae bacterium]
MSTSAAARLSGPWPPATDVPQVGFKEPPDHHEAYWLYGYDPVSAVGHYLYLAAEKDDLMLRRESVFLLLPDGSVLAQHGAGRASQGTTAAGDRLELECLEPFRRWRGRYAAPMHRLAGSEIVAGPGPDSELTEAVVDLEIESVAPPWNTEGDWGEQPPSLRYHQFCDTSGTVTVAGTSYRFAGPGFRSHSRRRREMAGFTGHAIINGRFRSGRGFGLLRYRATGARPERGRGYLYLDGELHDADVIAWPHLTEAVPGGERLTIELHAGRHRAVITAETIGCAFVTPGPDGRAYGAHPGGPGTVISPAFARYEWDGETGYGGLERSALRTAITVPAAPVPAAPVPASPGPAAERKS